MDRQEFMPWFPVEGTPENLWVEAIHDDYEYLRLLLREKDPTGPMLRILFDAAIAYRNVNESFRLQTWSGLRGEGALPSLNIVSQSRWLHWLVEEAGGVLDAEKLTHYAIYTYEDCVDVISEFPPSVEWLGA